MARKIDLGDRLFEDFEPAPLPPIAPDGGLAPPEPRPVRLRVLPPSLCDQGPCAHSHVIATIMESQDPLADVHVPPGRPVAELATPSPVRRQITRTCYPHPGIEISVNDTPVLDCSRWQPRTYIQNLEQSSRREMYMALPAGQAYAAQCVAFEDEQRRLAADDTQPQTLGDK